MLRSLRAGLTVTEVPITFVERLHGASKMSRAIIVEAFWRVALWGIEARLRALRGGQKAVAAPHRAAAAQQQAPGQD